MDIKFECAQCGQRIAIDESAAGLTVQCPQCQQNLVVPSPSKVIVPKIVAAPPRELQFIIVNFQQGTPEWREWRHSGIGASDAPVIMGENPWKTAAELLREKRGAVREREQNEAMARGNQLEPQARARYAVRTGKNVNSACLQNRQFSWLRASVDGITSDGNAVVEIKCGEKVYNSTVQSGRPPDYYYGQLQHTLAVTGLASIDFWCFLPDLPEVLVRVDRDEKYIQRLLSAEEKFWNDVQQTRKPILARKSVTPNPKLEKRDDRGWTLLHIAVAEDRKDSVESLLSQGSDVHAVDPNGNTPLHLAAIQGFSKIAGVLLAHGANINAQNTIGLTPLHIAVSEGHKHVLKFLLEKGADIQIATNGGITPLHLALYKGQTELAGILVGEETQLINTTEAQTKNSYGGTMLHTAAYEGDSASAKRLLQNFVEVNGQDNNQRTALHLAVWQGHKKIVSLLLANGAHPNVRDKDGRTPLHNAVASWDCPEDITNLLLTKGAEVNAKDNNGQTPLDLAYSRKEVAEILRSHGARVS